MSLQRPLLFPKRILDQIQSQHEESMGRPLAAVLTSATTNLRNLTPRLLALFLLHLPRDEASPIFEEVAWSIAEADKNSNAEVSAVAEASKKGFVTFEATTNEIFNKILLQVVQNRFEGVEKYEMLFANFPTSSESYVINRFETMASLINSKNVLTLDLLNRAVDELAAPQILLSKQKLARFIEYGPFSQSVHNRCSGDTPTQLLQMFLINLPFHEDISDHIKTLQLYLHIKNSLEQKGRTNTLESQVYSLALDDGAPQEARELGVILLEQCNLAERGPVAPLDLACEFPKECSIQALRNVLDRQLLPNAHCTDTARRFLLLFEPQMEHP